MKKTTDRNQIVSAQIFVSGRVQGVGYRNFCYQNALDLGLKGVVRNLEDGRVALEVEGEREKIETLIDRLRKGPTRSEVRDLVLTWKRSSLKTDQFIIDY